MPKFERPGKRVNPELKEELETIKKLPKEERRSRIQEFKEKVVEQKLGLAEMQEKFTEIVHREGKLPIKDLRIILDAALDQYTKEYNLDNYQKEVSREVVNKFLERKKSIDRVSEAFANDNDMFEALFGQEPKGKVKIRTTPAMIYVQCFDPEDYAFLSTEEFTGKEVSDAKRKNASLAYGMALHSSKLPSVNGLIAVENSSHAGVKYGEGPKDDIFDHEEQHIVQRLFTEEKVHELERMSGRMTKEEFEARFSENLRSMREDAADRHAKDEILAYFRGGTPKETIYFNLTEKPIYDYLKSLRERYENPDSQIYKRYVPIVDRAVEKILVEEYHEVIQKGIEAVMALESLQYSKDQIIALLIVEPLARWPKLVKRIKEHGK